MTGDPVASAPATGHLPTDAHRSYRRQLFEAGLLVPTGVEGVYGRDEVFESIISGFDRLVSAAASTYQATVRRFPPVMDRSSFLKTDHLRSFPDLSGDVCSFSGDDRAHREVLRRLGQGVAYGDLLEQSEVVLCPAVCHPLYPTLDPHIGEEGSWYDVRGWVFRHEPSPDPARLMSFQQHDIVYVGTGDGAREHRDRTLAGALEVYASLGVDATTVVANDPFFGRAGQMLATNQRDEELKFEVLAATSPAPAPTAIASANCHEDHFGRAFGLQIAGGSPAHSACFGFGLERSALALIWAHGTDPNTWPAAVRDRLWP